MKPLSVKSEQAKTSDINKLNLPFIFYIPPNCFYIITRLFINQYLLNKTPPIFLSEAFNKTNIVCSFCIFKTFHTHHPRLQDLRHVNFLGMSLYKLSCFLKVLSSPREMLNSQVSYGGSFYRLSSNRSVYGIGCKLAQIVFLQPPPTIWSLKFFTDNLSRPSITYLYLSARLSITQRTLPLSEVF